MRRSVSRQVSLAVLVVAVAIVWVVSDRRTPVLASTDAQGSALNIPRFEADGSWPKPFPNDWSMGRIGGMAVDYTNDHVWVIHSPGALDADDKRLLDTPPSAICCRPAPQVMEFDPAGTVVRSWEIKSAGAFKWDGYKRGHGFHVDYKGNVWLADLNTVIKMTKDGKFLLQIGTNGKSGGSNDITTLDNPTKMQVSAKTNELFVSDGYNNRRVIVFDADTGQYKRHWGAFGNKPDDSAPGGLVVRNNGPAWQKVTSPLDGPSPQQFSLVHGLRLSNDDLLYVADRLNNRIQVFRPDGTFVKEGYTRKETLGNGATYDVDLSADPQQRFVYAADGTDGVIWIMDRQSLKVLGHFARQGKQLGQFDHIHVFAVDTKGNVYTGETQGQRIQKFAFKGLSATTSQ